MRIEYLTYFVDFCSTESITKTAARFYMTPQGVSRALRQIETELDVKLYTRKGNKTVLTEAGRSLEAHARRIVKDYEVAKGDLASMTRRAEQQKELDPVWLLATPCASTYIINAVDLRKRSALPFGIRMREISIHRLFTRLGQVTDPAVGLVSIPLTPRYIELVDRLLKENDCLAASFLCSPLAILCSEGSDLARRDSLQRADVLDAPVVCYHDSVLLDALDDFIKEDQILDISNSTHALLSRLSEWDAIAYAPQVAEITMKANDPSIRVVPFAKDAGFFDTCFGFVTKREFFEDERIRTLMTYVESTFSNYSDPDINATFTPCVSCAGLLAARLSDCELGELTPPPKKIVDQELMTAHRRARRQATRRV